jgi:hypothetical protein
MVSVVRAESGWAALRARLRRMRRTELYYEDLDDLDALVKRCEITGDDVPGLIGILNEDLLQPEIDRFHELRTMPMPDGNSADWHNEALLATPSDAWIPAVVACRALIALRPLEALPLFIELLFAIKKFPRLGVSAECEAYFPAIGSAAVQPLCDAYDSSAPEERTARLSIAATLGMVGARHPELRPSIVPPLLAWLDRHVPYDAECNAEIICVLLDLQVCGIARAVRAAFDAECVDERYCGSWDELRDELERLG